MRGTTATTRTGGVAARTVAAVKRYGTGSTLVEALAGVTVAFEAGRLTAVMGPSGSGKSTLLHCLAGLDTLTSGQVVVGEVELGALAERERTLLRRDRIGVVFQAFNLLPALTAADNITLPSAIAGRPVDPETLAGLVATLGWSGGWGTGRLHCRAASSSGWPPPGRCSAIPTWSSPTSRPGTWTRAPPPSCSACWATPCASWAARS
jgi:putative ABC transport system ATP-binding protein